MFFYSVRFKHDFKRNSNSCVLYHNLKNLVRLIIYQDEILSCMFSRTIIIYKKRRCSRSKKISNSECILFNWRDNNIA